MVSGVGSRCAQAPQPVTLAVAGRANSAPWIAAHGRFVAVSWAAAVDGGSDIYVATSRDEGATFGAPVQVNRVAGDGRVGRRDPAARGAARAGRAPPSPTWSSPGTPRNRAPRSRSRDPATAAAASDRRCRCSRPVRPAIAAGTRWRSTTRVRRTCCGSTTAASPPPGRGAGQGGRAPAQGRARRRGDGADVELALRDVRGPRLGRSRDHRRASATAARRRWSRWPAARLVSAWRHVYAGNLRDIAFTESRDGGATFAKPARVSEDGWAINGCPDDGPALAADPAGGVHIVWPTVIPGDEPQGALFYAPMQASGGFAARVPHPDAGQPEAVASAGGGGRHRPAVRRLGRVDRRRAHGGVQRRRARRRRRPLRRADAPGVGRADAVSGDGAAGAGRGRRLDARARRRHRRSG